MKIILKIFIGLSSTFLFFILILLVTVRFELLNKSFLFENFEKHNVYAQLSTALIDSLSKNSSFSKKEKADYAEFIQNLSPQIIKPIIENNLVQILDFLNGKSRDIVISFSLQGIGFQDASGFRWSLAEASDKNLRENISILYGISSTLTIAIAIILAILVAHFVFFGKSIFLSGGIGTIIISLIGKYYLTIVGKELIDAPVFLQKLLGLMFSSLFFDIVTTWLVMGGLLILFWLGLHIKTKL
jgi:hypothetical protein